MGSLISGGKRGRKGLVSNSVVFTARALLVEGLVGTLNMIFIITERLWLRQFVRCAMGSVRVELSAFKCFNVALPS